MLESESSEENMATQKTLSSWISGENSVIAPTKVTSLSNKKKKALVLSQWLNSGKISIDKNSMAQIEEAKKVNKDEATKKVGYILNVEEKENSAALNTVKFNIRNEKSL